MVRQLLKFLPERYALLVIAILCFASRLPQLCSPYLMLDGDECVLAFMAKDMYQGKDISVFFWGQNYGFSLIEAAAILPFYALLGISTISVKLAMLSLWTIGVIFFYKSLAHVNEKDNALPLLLTLLLVSAPAWADWSMKARGGYLTSFTLSSISLYLVFNRNCYKSIWTYLLLAVLVNLIYQSQPFWLAGVLPLICYRLYTERSMTKSAIFILLVAVQFLLFHLYRTGIQNTFEPPLFVPDSHFLIQHIKRLPEYLYNNFHGWHYFSIVHAPNTVSAIWAVALSIITLVLAISGSLQLVSKRRNVLLIYSVMFIPLCLGVTLFSYSMEVRYLLPVTGFVIFSTHIFLNQVQYARWIQGGLIALILIGFISVATFWDFRYLKTTRQGLQKTITYLERNGIYYTYATNDMLSWQIMFYSKEKITSRGFRKPGRHAGYTAAVDKAHSSGKKTALIGFRGEFHNQPEDSFNKDMHGLFVRPNPLKKDLVKDFQF